MRTILCIWEKRQGDKTDEIIGNELFSAYSRLSSGPSILVVQGLHWNDRHLFKHHVKLKKGIRWENSTCNGHREKRLITALVCTEMAGKAFGSTSQVHTNFGVPRMKRAATKSFGTTLASAAAGWQVRITTLFFLYRRPTDLMVSSSLALKLKDTTTS